MFVPFYTILSWKNSLSELRGQTNIGKLFQILKIEHLHYLTNKGKYRNLKTSSMPFKSPI